MRQSWGPGLLIVGAVVLIEGKSLKQMAIWYARDPEGLVSLWMSLARCVCVGGRVVGGRGGNERTAFCHMGMNCTVVL